MPGMIKHTEMCIYISGGGESAYHINGEKTGSTGNHAKNFGKTMSKQGVPGKGRLARSRDSNHTSDPSGEKDAVGKSDSAGW